MSDVDTAAVDSPKALDPNRPIREGDIGSATEHHDVAGPSPRLNQMMAMPKIAA